MEFRLLRKIITLFLLLGSVAVFAQTQVLSPAQSPSQWRVNIQGADISAFISQVADITGKSFIVDPRVKGRVTVISRSSMPSEAVYQLFLSVLNVHGFVAIETDDGAVKIIPNATGKQESNTAEQRRGDHFITEVVMLKNASVAELVPVLRPLVPQYGHMAGVQSANALIISDHATNIARLKRVIANLDSRQDQQIEVIPLQHAWVGDIAKLLEDLLPENSGKKVKTTNKLTIVADERSNRLILKGPEAEREQTRELVRQLDQPFENKGVTQVIQLNYAEATKVAELLSNLIDDKSSGSKEKKQEQESTKFQADESLNALVVRAEPSVMSDVRNLVAQLDVRRSQVLIEAVIVEITGNNGEQLGVQWLIGDSDTGNPIIGTNFNNVGASVSEIATDVTAGTAVSVGKLNGAFLGGALDIGNGIDVGMIVQALASTSNANLLSTPSVMTLDNEEAEFKVGQNVPFITGQSTDSSDTTNPFTTIKREDVGVTLKVKPQINSDGSVRLEVYQEVSSLVPSDNPLAAGSADRITNKRSVDTTILIEDGETIVLGGLIQDDETTSESKVPLLGDIPVLGHLFRSEQKTKIKRNLMIFLRPKILTSKKQIALITDDKYQGIYRVEASKGDISGREVSVESDVNALFDRSQSNAVTPAATDNGQSGNE